MAGEFCTKNKDNSKISLIKEVFRSMEYGTNLIDLSESKKWFAEHDYQFRNLGFKSADVSCQDLKPINGYWKKFFDREVFIANFKTETRRDIVFSPNPDKLSVFERSSMLRSIADGIMSAANLFAEIILVAKGIPTKTTKKVDIPIMVEYLRFYSSACFSEHLYPESERCRLTVIPGQNALCTLVLGFAAAFFRGVKIVLLVESEMVPSAFLFGEICYRAGVPTSHLRVICSTDLNSFDFGSFERLTRIIYLGEDRKLFDESMFIFHNILFRSKCPMIVHNDADLNSACDAVIENAWSHFGELPWHLSHVYVQESVYENFIEMMKNRMNKLVIDSPLNSISDIGLVENIKFQQMRNNLEQKIKHSGGKLFCPKINQDSKHFVPIMLYDRQVIDDDELLPVVTILPYRNIIEAARLANNTKYGLAGSIWSQTYTIVQELEQLLDVSLIWINDYGLIKPEVMIAPRKKSGDGWFGTTLDFTHPFLWGTKFKDNLPLAEAENRIRAGTAVELSKKALQIWQKWPKHTRLECFIKLVEKDASILTDLELRKLCSYNVNIPQSTPGVSVTTESTGIIAIYVNDSEPTKNLIISELIAGNAVILIGEKFPPFSSQLMLACGFPANILNFGKLQDMNAFFSHEEVERFYRDIHPFWASDEEIQNLRLCLQLRSLKTSISSIGDSLTS